MNRILPLFLSAMVVVLFAGIFQTYGVEFFANGISFMAVALFFFGIAGFVENLT